MIPIERNLPESSRLGPDPQIVESVGRGGGDEVERCSDEADSARDLQRLETSIQWLKHERMIAALEAGMRAQNHKRRLACAGGPSSRQQPVVRPPEVSSALARRVAPRMEIAFAAHQRLPSAAAPKRSDLYSLGLLWAMTILFGSAVAMLVMYHVFSEGWSSAFVLNTSAASDIVVGEN